MKHPAFYVDEEVLLDARTFDRRMTGAQCTVKRVLQPAGGEHRYAVETIHSGLSAIVPESSLRQVLIPWRDCVFQPKRVLR